MRAFPPRLPDQPIFYPVTNEEYARQIARDWNTRSGTRAGFVTQFDVDDEYAGRFEKQVVGAREHEELWIPAEELPELNAHIDGRVVVIAAFFGDGFAGPSIDELAAEVATRPVEVFVEYFHWEAAGVAPASLASVRAAWAERGREAVLLGITRS
jgi:hypothetical protein